jgi:hypothetical protein
MENYQFYVCYHKNNEWRCFKEDEPREEETTSKLIAVPKMYPEFTRHWYIQAALQPKVKIN